MHIITGMHRSGTSFVANLVKRLGADFGDESLLIAKDRWNEKGYFENWEIVDANNRLILGDALAYLYRKVFALRCGPKLKSLLQGAINAPAFVHPRRAPILRRAPRLAVRLGELGGKYDTAVVKDVRFSLTIGSWRKAARVGRVLYCYRHPYAAARSLWRRQNIPLRKGLKLWLYHVNEFFEQAEGLELTMVDFDRFFEEDPATGEVERLCGFLGLPFDPGEASALLDEVLDRKLRHNMGADEDLPPIIAGTYARLHEWHAIYGNPRPFS